MTVGDFQKCIRALGELISAKTSAKEFLDAANALAPFANYKMEAFAEFLQLAEKKYGESRELPDNKPPKGATKPRVNKEPVVKPVPLTANDLVAAVGELKVRIRIDQGLTKEGVAADLRRFEKMTNPAVFDAVQQLGIKTKPKTKPEAFALLVNNTVAAQSGVERSDA